MTKLPMHFDAACPDCPASRLGRLGPLVGATKETCAFVTGHLGSREPLPARWERYGFGLIRRGVLIRQRMDADGVASAIDAAGPGCVFPLGSPSVGYAVDEAIVCLCPQEMMEEAVASGAVGSDLMALQRAALERVERLAHARAASTVRRKVARLLVVLAESLSPLRVRHDLPPGLQQRDLAALIGVRHETLNRVLADLDAEGVLRRGPGGAVESLALDALRALPETASP